MRKVEQQLINGILSGDKNAFDMMFRAYYSDLLYTAHDILRDKPLAEEVVQDVFVKLWKSGANISVNSSFESYLNAMVRNCCIDYLRANERRIKTVSMENPEVQLKLHELGMEPSFDEELFSDPAEIALKQALEQLPSQCKQIFILSRFEDLSNKEIAEKLHISVSTVKTQIARALKKLKEAVKDGGSG